MVTYVRRGGKLVIKGSADDVRDTPSARSHLSTPMISSMEPYESPITGKEVSSWGERNREMRANDCFDTRDYSSDHVWKKGREEQAKQAKEPQSNDGFEWR